MAVVALLCVLGSCVTAVVLGPTMADLAGCPREVKAEVSGVLDDVKRVKQLLPELGDVRAVHYRWRELRPRTCPDIGPMDFGYDGLAELSPERTAELRAGYPWEPDQPQIPADLAPHAPSGATWQRSAAADTALGAQVWLDAGSPTVYFTLVRA